MKYPTLSFFVVLCLILSVGSVILQLCGPDYVRCDDFNLRCAIQSDVIARQVRKANACEDLYNKLTTPINYIELQKNSVMVRTQRGLGTGILVTRQVGEVTRTFVWTAGHVVDGLKNDDDTFEHAIIYQEQRVNGLYTDDTKVEAKVVAYSSPDNGEDLALLEILQDNFAPLSTSAIFDLQKTPQPAGTELIHVGCMRGLYDSVSHGHLSQTDRDILQNGTMFDQTSCMIYPGSSGGGVYLVDGRCVGLAVLSGGPGLNFIVPVRRMMAWAEKENIMWALNSKLPVPLARAPTKLEKPIVKDTPKPMSPGGPK